MTCWTCRRLRSAESASRSQAEPGQKIVFERVLLTKDGGDKLSVGAPYVAGELSGLASLQRQLRR